MGRKEGEVQQASQILYPCMQAADIFELKADITQLGMDQRKVNVLAREVGPKLGFWKPVVVSHHMLMGLLPPPSSDITDDLERTIELKMSKSKPDSAIFMTDTREDIFRKIKKAYCPQKQVEENPILEYCKYIIFEKFPTLKIERPDKFGGDLEVENYDELVKIYSQGELFPLDLKNAVAEHIDKLIQPVREHFEKNQKAKELLEFIKKQKITREFSKDKKRISSIGLKKNKPLLPSNKISQPKTHTALHVLKGAVQKILGAKWTASVFEQGNHGRLTVQFDRKPSEDEVVRIEAEANKKIQDNQPVEVIEMNRKEAEKKFGDIIYDLFPIPEHITELKIAHIKGWNINTCNKKHTKTTGEIGRIKLTKTRFRDTKKLLEISFDVFD